MSEWAAGYEIESWCRVREEHHYKWREVPMVGRIAQLTETPGIFDPGVWVDDIAYASPECPRVEIPPLHHVYIWQSNTRWIMVVSRRGEWSSETHYLSRLEVEMMERWFDKMYVEGIGHFTPSLNGTCWWAG